MGEETTIHWHGVAHAMDRVPHHVDQQGRAVKPAQDLAKISREACVPAMRDLNHRKRSVTADDREDLAGDIARHLRGGEKDVGRRNFLWLCSTLHRGLGPELLHIFSRFV